MYTQPLREIRFFDPFHPERLGRSWKGPDSSEEYRKQVEIADNWVQKTLETKKLKAARAAEASSKGIIQESK